MKAWGFIDNIAVKSKLSQIKMASLSQSNKQLTDHFTCSVLEESLSETCWSLQSESHDYRAVYSENELLLHFTRNKNRRKTA